MDAAWVEQVLTKAGYNVLETSGGAIVLEDPTCILRSFESFVNFAWAAIGGLALVLLFGWGLAMVRGAKIDIVENIRNLFLLFAGLAMIPALVGFLIGRQVWECKKIVVSMEEVEKLISIEDIDKAARREEETTRREEAARERRERREAAAREKQASSSQPPAEQPTQSARPVQSTKPAVQSTRPTQSAAAKPTTKPAQTASSNARPAAARNTRIGKLSEQFETGGAGPGTINMKSKDKNGNWICPSWDNGGCSYGSWQIESSQGTMAYFISHLKETGSPYYNALVNAGGAAAAKRGDKKFVDAWQKLARDDPAGFEQAQYGFIRDKRYLPAANHFTAKGFNLESRSQVVKDVIWSMAVQHGGVKTILDWIAANPRAKSMSDHELVNLMYDQRKRYFETKTDVPRGIIRQRTVDERRKALEQLG